MFESYLERSPDLPHPREYRAFRGGLITCSSNYQMVLLSKQDQDNLVTICDMMNLDLATATLQYLESNRNMDEWVQRYVAFCSV